MLPVLADALDDRLGNEPMFTEERLGDGSVRYRMNEKIRKRAEAAAARLSFDKIADFERRVTEAVLSAR